MTVSRDLVNHKKGSWHKIDARSRKIIVKLVKTAKFAWKKATGWQILSSSIQIVPFAWRRSERLRRRLAYKPLRIFKLSYRSKVTHLRYYQFHFHFCCCTTTIFFSSARLRDTVEKSSRKSSEYKNDERESLYLQLFQTHSYTKCLTEDSFPFSDVDSSKRTMWLDKAKNGENGKGVSK